MSMAEKGFPHFNVSESPFRKDKQFTGARLTNKGNWRIFPCVVESPHEPWCLHFEWGGCTCGPEPEEVFVDTGQVQ